MSAGPDRGELEPLRIGGGHIGDAGRGEQDDRGVMKMEYRT
jgi:hypothetical protein